MHSIYHFIDEVCEEPILLVVFVLKKVGFSPLEIQHFSTNLKDIDFLLWRFPFFQK